MKQAAHVQEATVTGGQILADNSIIDLVRTDDRNIELVVWDGTSASILSSFGWNGKVFVAPTADQEIVKAVQFPSRMSSYETTGQLFGALRSFFALHRGLSAEAVSLLAYSALASWFPECASIWPCVS